MKWIKRGLITVVVLAVLAGCAVFAGVQLAKRKMDRRLSVPAYALALPTDTTALERGKYLFSSRGCADCHGANGAGRVFINDGGLMAKAPNISTGACSKRWLGGRRLTVRCSRGGRILVMPSRVERIVPCLSITPLGLPVVPLV